MPNSSEPTGNRGEVEREDMAQVPHGAREGIIAARVAKNQCAMPFFAIVADSMLSAANAAHRDQPGGSSHVHRTEFGYEIVDSRKTRTIETE
jgi:hypothetical protein